MAVPKKKVLVLRVLSKMSTINVQYLITWLCPISLTFVKSTTQKSYRKIILHLWLWLFSKLIFLLKLDKIVLDLVKKKQSFYFDASYRPNGATKPIKEWCFWKAWGFDYNLLYLTFWDNFSNNKVFDDQSDKL